MNTDYKIDFYNSLKELYDLYDKVRRAVILVENFDSGRQMYIAPINQLRSALDHIFKAVNCADNREHSEYELKEAKEHLDRAGYDALELLAGKPSQRFNRGRRRKMKTVTVDRISLFQDYCDTRIEGDSNLDCCIRILSDSILGTLKSANDADNIDASQLYNLTHVLRELENLKLELRVIKEGGEA